MDASGPRRDPRGLVRVSPPEASHGRVRRAGALALPPLATRGATPTAGARSIVYTALTCTLTRHEGVCECFREPGNVGQYGQCLPYDGGPECGTAVYLVGLHVVSVGNVAGRALTRGQGTRKGLVPHDAEGDGARGRRPVTRA